MYIAILVAILLGVAILLFKLSKLADRIISASDLLMTAMDETDIQFITDAYGSFTVRLANRKSVVRYLRKTAPYRSFVKNARATGVATAAAIFSFQKCNLQVDVSSYRGLTNLLVLLERFDMCVALTADDEWYKKNYNHKIRYYSIGCYTYFYIENDIFAVKDQDLATHMRKDGLSIKTLCYGESGLTVEQKNELRRKLSDLSVIRRAIAMAPKFVHAKQPFKFTDWCAQRKIYRAEKKRSDRTKEYVNGPFIYLYGIDWLGNRWPVAMGYSGVCGSKEVI